MKGETSYPLAERRQGGRDCVSPHANKAAHGGCTLNKRCYVESCTPNPKRLKKAALRKTQGGLKR
ncbi:MAG: hypothetical protein IJT30_08285 [Muribaculaceae bacterium]|nr:hypothetical protein [Muribaculaceae bacterium]